MQSSQRKRPHAVLFDYDGVLVASEPIHLSAWKQVLAELQVPEDTALIQSQVGKTSPEIMRQILNRYRPGWSETEYNLNDLALRKNTHYLKAASAGLETYPGVREGLKWLKSEKIPIAVVSNAKRRELEQTLKSLGLFEFFNAVISRDDVKAFKPDPFPYLFAVDSLGVEPENCVAVEDSPPGLEAALLARTITAAVLTNFSRKDLETPIPGRPDLKPKWIGNSIQEFFTWLKELRLP